MTTQVSERRAGRRDLAAVYGIVSARVRPGHDAVLIDLSRGGALIEAFVRLLPGAPVELRFQATDRRIAIGGRILRCAVVRLGASSVAYRAAIAFDNVTPWFTDDALSGYPIPSTGTVPVPLARVASTQSAV